MQLLGYVLLKPWHNNRSKLHSTIRQFVREIQSLIRLSKQKMDEIIFEGMFYQAQTSKRTFMNRWFVSR